MTGSSWKPTDLAAVAHAVAAGQTVGPVPTLMRRTDGVALLYPGQVHQLAGEPESGKGWITLAVAARLLKDRERVLMLDFETGPVEIVARLLALGVTVDDIAYGLDYVRPEEPPHERAIIDLAGDHALAIVDGQTEAYTVLGLDPLSNTDAATFLRRVAEPLRQAGAAVVLIDHVTKSKDGRGRFALGAGHKLAASAVAFSVEVIDRPSRTSAGRVKLRLEKDRHGHIPGGRGDTIAIVAIAPEDDGARVRVTIDPPDATDDAGRFRPTVIMGRVSTYLAGFDGATVKQIREGVRGKASVIDTALGVLVDEGFVRAEPDGQARRHHNIIPFTADEGVPVSQPCPTVSRDTVVGTVSPCPPPTGDTGRDTVSTWGQETNGVPVATLEQEQAAARALRLLDGGAA